MFKSGLVSISFRQLSVDEIVNIMKESGLDCVEWGSDVHAPRDDFEKLNYIAELQAKNGITCTSYGSYYRLGVEPVEELVAYAKAAKILGTTVIRIWCGNKNYEAMDEQERAAFIEQAKLAAKIAEAEGVTLCMECHNNTFTNQLEGALRLMEEVDSNAFRMYWQPNQFRDDETNFKYAEQIAKYTVNVHVFNWKGSDKYPLADATELWRKYLSYFSGNEALLLEFMPDGKPETLPTEADALKNIIKGV